MTHGTFFVQPCHTCGRQLQVRVEYLGRSIKCRHCHAEFMANDSGTAATGPSPYVIDLPHTSVPDPIMARVDELLAGPDDHIVGPSFAPSTRPLRAR